MKAKELTGQVMNKVVKYPQIKMLQSATELRILLRFIFQEDNDTNHTSTVTMEDLDQNMLMH